MDEGRKKTICFGCNKKWWHKCQKIKSFNLKNNDEEEIEASTQTREEEPRNCKDKKKDVQILHKINQDRSDIYIYIYIFMHW